MSTIKDRMTADLRTAMKARDTLTTSVLRMVLGEIARQEKSGKVAVEFGDAEVQTLLRKEVKKRQDTAEIYREAGQIMRFHEETRGADMISVYLPTSLSEAEVEALVDAQIAEQGATTVRDMGKVVKAVLAAAEGRVDGKTVSTLVKARLG